MPPPEWERSQRSVLPPQRRPPSDRNQPRPLDEPFNYNLDSKNNPIKKGKRTTNPDGSWREEVPQGAGCVKVREMTPSREYREHTECAQGGGSS